MTRPSLSLLSGLWLAEPDAETLAFAREAGFPAGDPAELSAAWADLFLLNVYPYATAFTDLSGELNGPAAAAALRRYEAAGYRPAELSVAGAPDHAGLCLGYIAHRSGIGRDDPGFLAWTLDWLPVCALAIERQPTAPAFYREMAAATREVLFSSAPESAFSSAAPEDLAATAAETDPGTEEENNLSRVVRFLLAPAACGLFLSRSRLGALALEAGLRLPFGPRFEVARSLFEAAGECGRADEVLAALLFEVDAWDVAYAALARDHRAWETRARVWQDRLRATRQRLEQMRRLLETPLELEYEKQKES